jgi:hypothetical protein
MPQDATMSERNEAVPAGGPSTTPEDPPRGTGRYSVPEAARALGISERAIRKRIVAGTLPAEKDGPRWVVFLPTGTRSGPEAVLVEPAVPEAVLGTTPGAVPGGTDLEPLAEVITGLTRENRQLAEAAVVWQFRALQAEERLKALEAGLTPQTSEEDPVRASEMAQDAPIDRPWLLTRCTPRRSPWGSGCDAGSDASPVRSVADAATLGSPSIPGCSGREGEPRAATASAPRSSMGEEAPTAVGPDLDPAARAQVP